MIDLTNAPKDATHYYKRRGSDGSLVFYKVLDSEYRTMESYHDNEWGDDSSDLMWLIDNLTRIEWPIELVNGEVYQFDYNNGKEGMNNAVMRYDKRSESFYFDDTHFKLEHCTNIIKLVPEVK